MSNLRYRILVIFIVLANCFQGIAQRGTPLSSPGGNPDSPPIELTGDVGDPEFVVWLLQSEFGWYKKLKVDSSDLTRIAAEWDVDRKELNSIPFVLSFRSAVDHVDHIGDVARLRMYIQCRDATGKNLLVGKDSSSLAIRKLLQTLLFQTTSYVNSSTGLNVRKRPSLTAPIDLKLPDKARVIVKKKTNQRIDVLKGDRSVNTEWVQVFVNGDVSGYVASTFLIPFNAVHPADIKALNDSISESINIELVDIGAYRKKKITNPYFIDKTDISIKTKPYVRPGIQLPDQPEKRNAFYLPINNGRDSLYVHGSMGEYGGYDMHYYGRISALNQYVVAETGYFFIGYVLYDMGSGKETLRCNGLPVISPDGKLFVDFYYYEDSEDWDYNIFVKLLSVSLTMPINLFRSFIA